MFKDKAAFQLLCCGYISRMLSECWGSESSITQLLTITRCSYTVLLSNLFLKKGNSISALILSMMIKFSLSTANQPLQEVFNG